MRTSPSEPDTASAPAGAPLILVTGAARRVGAAIARRLHAGGARLALHYRHSAGEAEALAAELCALRADSAFTVGGDLARFGVAAEIAAAVLARGGRLDGLVNNASSFFPTAARRDRRNGLGRADRLQPQGAPVPVPGGAPHCEGQRRAIINIVDIHAERPLKGYPLYSRPRPACSA
jgi:pteridine reductase